MAIGSTPKPRALVSWSSGKDAAWTLHVIRQSGDFEIAGLFTTYNESANRVAMHGVRRSLLEVQARAVGLPLIAIGLPPECTNAEYEKRVAQALVDARDGGGVTHMIFGDLFLSDIRRYRERQMAELKLTPVFPLWEKPTLELAHQMLDGGLKAVISCVDTEQIPAAFSGRDFDESFLADRPDSVDACGENGEFHTFVYDGPMFRERIQVRKGKVHADPRFVFTDLVPIEPEPGG